MTRPSLELQPRAEADGRDLGDNICNLRELDEFVFPPNENVGRECNIQSAADREAIQKRIPAGSVGDGVIDAGSRARSAWQERYGWRWRRTLLAESKRSHGIIASPQGKAG